MKPHVARLITGVSILTIGVLLLLNSAGVSSVQEVIGTWWPSIGIIAGLIMVVSNPRNYLWALFAALAGVVFQLHELDILKVSPWSFVLPIIVILIGVSIIFNFSASKKRRVSRDDRDDMYAILSGTEQHNTSQSYKGSKIYAIMGGAKVDLRKVKFAKEATIEITGVWGGVEVIVPRDVVVKNETLCILGAVEDKTNQTVQSNSPVLYIIGDIVMASVEIRN